MRYTIVKDFNLYTNKITKLKRLHFSENEINSMKSIIPNIELMDSDTFTMRSKHENGVFYIYKYSDEWYTVKINYKNTEAYVRYLCDQFPGVLDCLKDLIEDKIIKENKEDRLYRSVSSVEYLSKRKNLKQEKFSEKECECMKEIFPMTEKSWIDNSMCIYIKTKEIQIKSHIIKLCGIKKFSDEWYYIYTKHDHFYLCDEIKGLINCLKDLKNNYEL